MRNPFEDEKEKDIGLDMTPGRSRNVVSPISSGSNFKMHRGAIGIGFEHGFNSIPNSSTYNVGNNGNNENSDGHHSTKVFPKHASEMKKGGMNRRCIVKVDKRGWGTGTKDGMAGNRRLISQRLSPFMKQGNGFTGCKVAYIDRPEAIQDDLFSANENGYVDFKDPKIPTKIFDTDQTYSIILSPEDQNVDFYTFTRRFMEEIYPLHSEDQPKFWVAGVHGNTDHKHVHILVNCKGMHGGDARLNWNYVKSGRLQKDVGFLLTKMMGPRTMMEEMEAMRKAKDYKRLMPADDIILSLADQPAVDGDGSRIFKTADVFGSRKKSMVNYRLQQLKAYGLVEHVSRGVWRLNPNMEIILRKADFANEFGLSAEEMAKMHIDMADDVGYEGHVMESAETSNSNSMLFMIKEENGLIHLHRESLMREIPVKKKKKTQDSENSAEQEQEAAKKQQESRYIIDNERRRIFETLDEVRLEQYKKNLSIIFNKQFGGRKKK